MTVEEADIDQATGRPGRGDSPMITTMMMNDETMMSGGSGGDDGWVTMGDVDDK